MQASHVCCEEQDAAAASGIMTNRADGKMRGILDFGGLYTLTLSGTHWWYQVKSSQVEVRNKSGVLPQHNRGGVIYYIYGEKNIIQI